MSRQHDFPIGMVWLVGAGPGDPELLTCKAARLIGSATVIFHDALVGAGILDLASPHARRVYVGKRSGRHSRPQAEIDRLLVDAALSGERVVRLKGGDPAIFGRVAEELAACQAAGVPVRICPGVTAASAAAASLGISLTLRGSARKLTFVTGHAKAGAQLDLDWQALADPASTIAVYMGKGTAAHVTTNLLAAGALPDTPVALIENATMAGEHCMISRLDLLPLLAETTLGEGPALLLIGQAIGTANIAAPLPRSLPPLRLTSCSNEPGITCPLD